MKSSIKLICLTFLAVILTQKNYAFQSFEGQVVYEGIYNSKKYDDAINDPKTSLERRELLQNALISFKNLYERTYQLIFTTNESIYKELNTLKLKENNVQYITDIYYKNLQEGSFINKIDFDGAQFLVKDSMQTFEWSLAPDIKKIGNYICNKATLFDIYVYDDKMPDGEGGFNTITHRDTIKTTVWYTPKIPISNGPRNYGGLPGLILEIEFNKEFKLVCTEIVLNPVKPVKIKPPKSGKAISLEEYEKAVGLKR
ncbi:GLPGLI family protein [Flavobacteriaceae bacterium F08102]|nr:GLPGLI family protein [Flavobacteriaceae bacterium F08102]